MRALAIAIVLSSIACTPREPAAVEQTDQQQREPTTTQREPSVRVELSAAMVPEAIARPLLDDLQKPDHVLLALRHRIDDEWHIYWRNPGETGLPTRITVHGVEAGDILYPSPERFVAEGGQISYGWAGEVVLFALLREPIDTLTVESRWLACKESCVPGKSEASLSAAEAGSEPLLREMIARVPRPIGERLQAPTWTREADTLSLGASVEPGPSALEFFPYATDPALFFAEQRYDVASKRLELRWRTGSGELPATGQGVLVWTRGEQTLAYELALPWPET